ncbi:acetyl-CoA carboxylase biotin carboxyl carrier protein [Acetobacterium sp.]|jgi:acetyl-CoA carboxylase biotin carboxyl carrier protein|uniref:acetyl-CoA carboxylase biotin carboxyl carrier protein n=1 Tax=Acetobacterium sp. TaxID=1872094 RepID=UPI00271E6171|nr:acetyl-CoA carboxylase biotin carboxyl carrier protein [Acetobacterium sp.]MDO9492631.1 acetyl-CoA carboxylase biotin carboxyl carrier protein [Acetobacterium sp.]
MELNIETIQALARIMSEEKLTSLALDQGNLKIEIKREIGSTQASGITFPEPQMTATESLPHHTQPVAAEAIEIAETAHWKEIKSPMVGVFYQSSQPDKPAYVVKGQSFAEGDTLCIIEAMKLMNEITAETPGTIMEVCVGNGQVVEFGQVLYRIVED